MFISPSGRCVGIIAYMNYEYLLWNNTSISCGVSWDNISFIVCEMLKW